MLTNCGAERADVRTTAILDACRSTSFRADILIWTLQENGVDSTTRTTPEAEGETIGTCSGVVDRDPFTAGRCFMWPDTACHRVFTGTSRCKDMPRRSRRQPSAGRSFGTSTLRRTPIREAGGHTREGSGCRSERAEIEKPGIAGLFATGGVLGIPSADTVCGIRFRQRNRSDSNPN